MESIIFQFITRKFSQMEMSIPVDKLWQLLSVWWLTGKGNWQMLTWWCDLSWSVNSEIYIWFLGLKIFEGFSPSKTFTSDWWCERQRLDRNSWRPWHSGHWGPEKTHLLLPWQDFHFYLVTAIKRNRMTDAWSRNEVSSFKWLGSFGGFLNHKSVCRIGGFWVSVGGRDNMGGRMGSCVWRWWVRMTQDRLLRV